MSDDAYLADVERKRMITILRSTELGLERIEELADGSWVNLVDPGPEEVERLSREFDIPPDFITSVLDVNEQARTEREDDAILIVVRVPHFHGESSDIPYTTMPIGIVLTSRVIVTVCKSEASIITQMLMGQARGLSTTKRNRFVLRLLLAAANQYLLYMRNINQAVDALEDELQTSLRNKEVLELLKYQKSLTYFTTALKSNELMMGRLQRSRLFHTYPEDDDLLEDVVTEIDQAIAMTKISGEILSQMMDAFASIISNNLNVVMKFLASATIILALPGLVASVYGMNIDLPFQKTPYAFMIVMGVSLVLALIVTFIFNKRDWL
jgi:magnesium transporter